MNVYLDNAATTPLDKAVLAEMLPFLEEHFGNPSSIHAHGRKTRSAIELARKKIANLLNTSPSEIFFTSGGTEADNFAIMQTIETYQIQHAITSPLEHHAVLHTLESLAKNNQIKLSIVNVNQKGDLDYAHLEELLKNNPKSMVSLMHANNEIGNLYDIQKIGEMVKHYQGFYHTDTVQTMGHYRHDLQKLPVDFLVGAAHKFHGPKGVGFLYLNAKNKIHPLIHGGAQERNMRGGTENVYGIIGIAKALELAYQDMDAHQKNITALKKYMIEQLQQHIEGIEFNGRSAEIENSLYTVLNVSFPPSEMSDMLLFNLDIQNISVSGGSACSSGSDIGSHVLRAIGFNKERAAIRFSFSRMNTKADIDYTIDKLKALFPKNITMDIA
jgi:cysteine desulfurase